MDELIESGFFSSTGFQPIHSIKMREYEITH